MGMTIGVKTAFNISNNGEISATKVSENVPIIRNSDLDELTLGEILIRSRKTGNLKTYMKPNFLQADKPVAEEYEESFFRTFDANANVYDIEKTVELRPEPVKRKFNFDF